MSAHPLSRIIAQGLSLWLFVAAPACRKSPASVLWPCSWQSASVSEMRRLSSSRFYSRRQLKAPLPTRGGCYRHGISMPALWPFPTGRKPASPADAAVLLRRIVRRGFPPRKTARSLFSVGSIRRTTPEK